MTAESSDLPVEFRQAFLQSLCDVGGEKTAQVRKSHPRYIGRSDLSEGFADASFKKILHLLHRRIVVSAAHQKSLLFQFSLEPDAIQGMGSVIRRIHRHHHSGIGILPIS